MHERERVYNAHSFRIDRGESVPMRAEAGIRLALTASWGCTEFLEREGRNHG